MYDTKKYNPQYISFTLAAEFTKQFYIETFFLNFIYVQYISTRAWTTTTRRPEYSGLLRALDQTFTVALVVIWFKINACSVSAHVRLN